MMKYLIAVVLTTIFLESKGQSDLEVPVDWHVYVEKTSSEAFEMNFDAVIKDGWTIYSSQSPDGGPIPTSVLLSTSEISDFESDLIEPISPLVEFEPLFDQEVWKFKEKAKFLTTLKSQKENTVVKGTITYMACNGRQCLPPTDVPFVVVLN